MTHATDERHADPTEPRLDTDLTHAHLRAIFDASPDMLFVLARDGRVIDVNNSATGAYGFTRDEFLTLQFSMFCGSTCNLEQAAHHLQLAAGGQDQEFEWVGRRRNGGEFPVEVRLCRLGKDSLGDAVLAVIRDITRRKRTEAALRASEERFRGLIEATADLVWETDAETRYTYLSPQVQDILGYTTSELTGGFAAATVADTHAGQSQTLTTLLSGTHPFQCVEFYHRHKDGHQISLESSGVPHLDSSGRLIGYRGVTRDVNERRNAERKLRAQDERYRTLVNTLTEGVIVQDRDGRVVTCNPSAARLLGTTQTGLLEVDPALAPLFHPCFDENGEHPIDRPPNVVTLATGEPQRDVSIAIHRPDNTVAWLQVNTSPMVLDPSSTALGVLVSITDVTERRTHVESLRVSYGELEKAHRELQSVHAQLVQSEKMASIGSLAAGVAHEINNPVGYVNANLNALTDYLHDLLRLIDACDSGIRDLPPEHPTRRGIEELKTAIDLTYLREDVGSLLRESQDGITRVKQIVQDLKDFSRSDGGEWQFADLNRGLDSTLNIVWNELKYKCTVSKQYGPLPEIECVPPQINQVFMNLLVNASQAIAEHGEVTIRTGTADNDWVWVAVSDTGSGIPPENMPRLFDPFFTTKPVGKGTGLGLSISYGIIARHGGRIEVQSVLGKGSTFTVWLPVHRPAADAVTPAPVDPAPAGSPPGSSTPA